MCRKCIRSDRREYRQTQTGRAAIAKRKARPEVRARNIEQEQRRIRPRTDRTKEQARRAAARYRLTERGEAKRKAFKADYNRRPEVAAKAAQRERNRRAESAGYRLAQRISAMVRAGLAVKGNPKARRPWQHLLGYTRDQLKRHIERQFHDGMSWDNAGQWEIDHIVPLALFKYESADDLEFRAAWALTNLRPLWMRANRTKGARRTLLL